MRPNIVRNVQRLGERGLSFDLLTLPPQLAAAVELVAACPDTQFVLDHISKPYIAKGEIEPWAKDMKDLGALPNVVVKVSGMVTEAKWDDWTPETFRPYVDVVTENFGPKRMMFGSDWPVSLLGGTYDQIVGIVETITADWSASEKEALWSTTAISAYRLKDLIS